MPSQIHFIRLLEMKRSIRAFRVKTRKFKNLYFANAFFIEIQENYKLINLPACQQNLPQCPRSLNFASSNHSTTQKAINLAAFQREAFHAARSLPNLEMLRSHVVSTKSGRFPRSQSPRYRIAPGRSFAQSGFRKTIFGESSTMIGRSFLESLHLLKF